MGSWSAVLSIVREQEARATKTRKGKGEYKEYHMVKIPKHVDTSLNREALFNIERAAGRPWTPATENTPMGF